MSISNVDKVLLRFPNCLAKIAGKDAAQVARDKAKVINNMAKLTDLRIMFSHAAYETLTGVNSVLAVIFSSIDLQNCGSAQEAVKLINTNRSSAMKVIFDTRTVGFSSFRARNVLLDGTGCADGTLSIRAGRKAFPSCRTPNT